MKQPFSITKEDWENSSKDYIDYNNCPATIAAKRQLGFDSGIMWGNVYKHGPERPANNPPIGKISKKWDIFTFKELEQGIEFHTEIEIYGKD